MLLIDDNMLKLSKMLETLLERLPNERQVNLKKYENTVKEIDRNAFDSLLDEIDQFNNHNQTLEDELQFLEQIKCYYEQVFEMQLNFRTVSELYGDSQLELSDLSQIDIEYIDYRISIISGYLINIKNIDSNKKKLEELNESLIEKEKNDELLRTRLKEYEEELRNNFITAEGRCMIDGKLSYISVVSEYEKLGYDFRYLLDNSVDLMKELKSVTQCKIDAEDKMRAAEVCYNSVPNSESRQILDEIMDEFLDVKYRLTMLKIIELLSKSYDNYDPFKDKREKLLDLIKYRKNCLDRLGKCISIDPFSRTRVSEQLDMISSFKDNSRIISKLKKDIAQLSQRVEDMIEQNNTYMVSINTTQNLIVEKKDEDVNDNGGITIPFSMNDYVSEKTVLDNQLVDIKVIPLTFNIDRVLQKTRSVVKRCYEMVNGSSLNKSNDNNSVTPNLVIVQQPVSFEKTGDDNNLFKDLDSSSLTEMSSGISEDDTDESSRNDSIFETLEPFESTPLFTDRLDNNNENKKVENNDFLDLKFDTSNKNDNLELVLKMNDDTIDDEMPDAFWVTQEDNMEDKKEDVILSFDEQIDALLANDSDAKVKKLVA